MKRGRPKGGISWQKDRLARLAKKIRKIPTRFATNGKLDLEKVNLVLKKYQKIP